MGYSSKQWLNRGEGLRDRGYRPISVAIEPEVAVSEWSEDHKVVVEINARLENDQYQVFYLTRAEAEKCAGVVLGVCTAQVSERLVMRCLKNMTATKLLKVLTSILRARLRDGANPSGE